MVDHGQSDDENSFEDDTDPTLPEEISDWGGDELEAAYMKAMSALEASEATIPVEPIVSPISPNAVAETERGGRGNSADRSSAKSVTPANEPSSFVAESLMAGTETNAEHKRGDPAEVHGSNISPVERPPTPRQIIEACLFVGGTALTASRLSGVLRGEFDSEFVDRAIDELNQLYAAECRPYEIRLGEGGYRLALRDEFERIRHKAYGLGPKEVRLSQDALEVLAVVAYHQPIKQSRVEELGKPGCGAVLRQLVRRELLAVERDREQPRDVNYKTTARFLSLFGIHNLDELPRHEQVSYK